MRSSRSSAGTGGGPNDACNGIVHPAVTMVSSDGSVHSGPAMAGMVLAVDMAISPDGKRVAVVSAGNATNTFAGGPTSGPALTQVFVSDTDQRHRRRRRLPARRDAQPVQPGGRRDADLRPGDTACREAWLDRFGRLVGGVVCGVPNPDVPQVVGQPIAVAFEASGTVVVQSREPAMLAFADGTRVTLSTVTRADTGHLVFHSNAGGFLACASCHAEGNDDGRVWNFTCQGPRRTQSLHAGALRGSEPFHWDGERDRHDPPDERRVRGPHVGPDAGRPTRSTRCCRGSTSSRACRAAAHANPVAVERGRALFNDPTRGACASCHSGAGFTNNATVDVGTGRAFQVPSLVGIGSRGPFMHNGCAKTLAGRFDAACGGGDRHGRTSAMTPDEINDLISYLQSI